MMRLLSQARRLPEPSNRRAHPCQTPRRGTRAQACPAVRSGDAANARETVLFVIRAIENVIEGNYVTIVAIQKSLDRDGVILLDDPGSLRALREFFELL